MTIAQVDFCSVTLKTKRSQIIINMYCPNKVKIRTMIKPCTKVPGLGLWCLINAIFNNFSIITWRSVLLVEETGITGENHRPACNPLTYII